MRDTRIGRVLVASLHQAIADILPDRLVFYENWLSVTGLRDGTIGLAPLFAVLSFLRQEGDVYQAIMVRAGEYAADWTVQSLSSARRTAIRLAPRSLRSRMLLRMAGQFVRRSNRDSRAIAKLRKNTATVNLRGSIFCLVREPVPRPLCGFYAAAFARLLTLFDIDARVARIACRGTGESACGFDVALAGASVRES